jgi:pimeloyl-ACP methyl ester carboxylesterase
LKNVRFYGSRPYTVAVIHGGPGAPGEMAPVARELSKYAGVLEPLQTEDTINGQVEELADVLKKYADIPVVLSGHSWGATLSYITAARYPQLVKKLVLIGMPPLQWKDRPEMSPVWLGRLTENERVEFFELEETVWDGILENKSEPIGKLFRLIAKGDCYEMIPHKDDVLEYQIKPNVFIFRELAKLTEGTQLIDLGKKIDSPVTAIHGDSDIRCPASAIKQPLASTVKDFKLILLKKCGHYPWREKFARDRFYDILKEEIQ